MTRQEHLLEMRATGLTHLSWKGAVNDFRFDGWVAPFLEDYVVDVSGVALLWAWLFYRD